jgi:hypothetical protein
MGAYINNIKEKDYIDEASKTTPKKPQNTRQPNRTPSNKIVSQPPKSFKEMTREEYEDYLGNIRGV